MFRMEDHHWWFVGSRRILLDMTRHVWMRDEPVDVLDVGCGTGATLSQLPSNCRGVGVEMERLGAQSCRARGLNRIVRAQGEALPFPDASFDLVFALDVLEHIADDSTAAAELMRVLRPGGTLLVTVPAHPFLWSRHDVALHHERRYRRGELQELLLGAGLQLDRLSFYNAGLFVPIAAVRLAQRLLPSQEQAPRSDVELPPAWLNAVLRGVFSAERWVLRHMVLPFGVSLIAWGTRAEEG